MKKLFSIIGTIIAFIFLSYAWQTSKQITLQWDAMPSGEKWTEVRIYDITQSPEVLVATSACNSAGVCPSNSVSFTVQRAAHSYVARSYDGFWESADSNVVEINAPPKIPANLKK
jgi:hypothetical protein